MRGAANLKGEGVGGLEAKIPKDVAKRIEVLGRMNDRRNQYRNNRMKDELMKLAMEYRRKGMMTMALEVRKEAEEL